jgi:hypothetical protein
MSQAERKLLALHLVAGAMLLLLGYKWLGVGESTRWWLALNALDALAILALVCWLHGATLLFFRGTRDDISAAFRVALRRVPVLVLAAIVVLVLYGLLAMAVTASAQPAFRLASWMTLTLRVPVRPAMVMRVFLTAFWIVRWIVLPVALVPLASEIAANGWRGFKHVTWRASWRYWATVPVLLAAGLLLPLLLLRWVPVVSGFTMETVSFSVRGLVSYLLFVVAIWTLERLTPKAL